MTRPDDELLRGLQTIFKVEALEYLQKLNSALLQLERTTDESKYQALLHEVFRAAHNMKGAARTAEFREIHNLAHGIESVFQQARESKLTLSPATCDVLYHAFDAIKALLEDKPVDLVQITTELAGINAVVDLVAPPTVRSLALPETELSMGFQEADFASAGEDTVRVAVNKLDTLMADTGELLTARISAEGYLGEMDEVVYHLSQWPKTLDNLNTLLRKVNGKVGAQIAETLIQHQDYLQTLTQQIDGVHQSIARNTLRLGMITDRIQDEVRQVRLVPFHSVGALLQRTVRDAAHDNAKQVNILQVTGGEVELDKKVLEMLKDPLIHLLRNAVVHGIEKPADRQARSKPAEGRITLSVQQRGNEVVLIVADDGRGFDLDALRARSSQNGRALIEGAASDDDLINLAFQPGISTAEEITELAGRGVGLDVVRQVIDTLQGRVTVKSQHNQGTIFELIVPVSLTTTYGLLVRTGREQYILPLLSIEKIIRSAVTFTVEGQAMITVDNQPIPLVSLAAALNRPLSEPPDLAIGSRAMAVVVKAAEQRVAFWVDDILAQQEVTVKPLSKLFPRISGVVGAAILGGGEPVLVLNAIDLVKYTKRIEFSSSVARRIHEPDPKHTAQPDIYILVVDDSITTRTLEKNILQAAGYKVITATDGELALKQLKENKINLVVSDVQMPNMDGIALTTTLRESKQYAQMPIILVTSLENHADRERGLLAGANAYIVKRGFDQAELLSTIENLL
jgi:two-component system chemotaxis sensor kinase CheA